jgi:hypothetical protein
MLMLNVDASLVSLFQLSLMLAGYADREAPEKGSIQVEFGPF